MTYVFIWVILRIMVSVLGMTRFISPSFAYYRVCLPKVLFVDFFDKDLVVICLR
jgi:hypothetical protein